MYYYKVTYEVAENIYSCNMVIADSVTDVEKRYQKYNWCSIHEANSEEIDEAQVKGMPFVNLAVLQSRTTHSD